MADGTFAEVGTTPNRPLRYRVDGMDCPSCAGKIETAVGRLGGTRDIRVNFQSQVLTLRLDEATTSRALIEDRIRRLGFGITPAQTPTFVADKELMPGGVHAAPAWQGLVRDPKVRLTIIVGLLLLAAFATSVMNSGLGDWPYLPAALVGVAFFGRRALVLAWSGSPSSIEMLMSVAAIGAIIIGATAEAATVVFLFSIGELLERVAAGRARSGIRALQSLMPRTALLVEGDSTRSVSAASLRPGDVVLVRPGDRVAADGEVVEGQSDVDESPITGESMPVIRCEGDRLVAGSINASGVLQVRVTRTAEDNTIARIIRMVEEAVAAKAPTARFIERFSRIYTPVAVSVALFTAILPPLALGQPWETWIYRGLALLLIACPCALVLSTPAAIASGLAAGARHGLLVKGGAALETIGRVRTAAFDKTGTLTQGKPRVTDVLPLIGTERSILGLAAAVENGSSHPLGRAILERAAADGIPLRPSKDSRVIPGRAVEALITGKRVGVGSPAYAGEQAPLSDGVGQVIKDWEVQGKTVVVLIVDGAPIGLIAVRDEPRADASAGILALRDLGIQSVMLSGDNPRTAGAIASVLGLDVKAGLLPGDKLSEIAILKKLGPVVMVGDGINDAPSLAAADVGIAMGGGTDVALEAADAAIMTDRVSDVAALVRLSRATMVNIRQNVTVTLGLKGLFLVTTIAGLTGLWPAVIADTGATVLVTLNALRLLRVRPTR